MAVILFIVLSCCLTSPANAAAPTDGLVLTEPEKWVLSQVKEGRKADLAQKFGGQGPRIPLRAAFLETLIMGGVPSCRVPCRGIQIDHAAITGPLNLEYLEVDYPLALSHCLFHHPLVLQECHFKKDLTLNSSTFLQSANFKGLKVDGSVSCNDVVFEQESLWSDAKIGEKFHALRAVFRSREARADFNALKVGSNAFFTSAIFCGPVDFGLLHVGRQLNFNKTEFLDKESVANFISARVEQIAYFKEVRFHGPVDFAIAQIGMQFNADNAEFLHKEKTANFSGIKVGNTIYFQQARFHGPVKFEFAEIGINFRGTGAEFLNPDQLKNFSKMKVNQKVFLNDTAIFGPVEMSYSDFNDLDIDGVKKPQETGLEPGIQLSRLNLKGTLVQRELKIARAAIADLNADNVIVKGPALFLQIAISKRADFRNATFQGLDFRDMTWPDKDETTRTRNVYLNDLTYNSISINKGKNCDYDKKGLIDFLEASPFNTQSYVQMEGFFKRIGREPWANEIFIRMHDRDLAEKLAWWDPRRWLEWFFWGLLAGYGRAPFRVMFISLLLIIIGALIYDPDYLAEEMRPPAGKPYKSAIMRCFLSLDRFLPVDLGLGKQWDSRATHFLIWFYYHLELILGWILIPIALASIYTQIK